jgi:hypothetical protein
MDILILCLVLAFGILIGWNLRERVAVRLVEKMLSEIQEDSQENPDVTRMRLEKHSDVIYAYSEDDTFIAQGNSLKDLDLAIRKRFPDRKFSVREENLKSLGVNYDTI